MKKATSAFIKLLSHHINIELGKESVYEISTYITVMYALISQKSKALLSYNVSVDDPLLNLLEERYPLLTNRYHKVHRQISSTEENKLIEELGYMMQDDYLANAFTLSEIYQLTKNYLLRTMVQSKASYPKGQAITTAERVDKIEGQKMLFQTQFFTDSYMVEFLVDEIVRTHDDLSEVIFVDPASGGGNFLLYAYYQLYQWYQSHGYTECIPQRIFENNLLGYDLDADLAQIAHLSLFMFAYQLSPREEIGNIYNFSGIPHDYKGSLSHKIASQPIAGETFESRIERARKKEQHIIYVTNPPFLGKRDMDLKLKEYLQDKFPSAKGDLCFSFMLNMLRNLKEGDTLAIVAQNGWLNLSSMKDFRKVILSQNFLRICVDLGSNAFKNINGEKTNVVLALLERKSNVNRQEPWRFINLRPYDIEKKAKILSSRKYTEHTIFPKLFMSNHSYEFNYLLGEDTHLLNSYPKYGDFARCMQGSSTGDNHTMVKYIWQIADKDWKLASKGGGYSKWEGLNIYKVKWGKDGEAIKANPGGVLRNPTEIKKSALVFSDTGTLGLNVRIKLKDQVFMASGPGIKIKQGNTLCHMAFLNSKVASFLLRTINPKFTLSGGYIEKLPVARGILNDSHIQDLATKCLALKAKYLTSKLPNAEYREDDFEKITDVNSYLLQIFLTDMQNQYERLICEKAIDDSIISRFQLSDQLTKEYEKYVRNDIAGSVTEFTQLTKVDHLLASILTPSCMVLGRKITNRQYGSENSIEVLSIQLQLEEKAILQLMYEQGIQFAETLDIYKKDLIHKIILKLLGIHQLDEIKQEYTVHLKDLDKEFELRYPLLHKQLGIKEDVLDDILSTVHPKVFLNTPFIHIK